MINLVIETECAKHPFKKGIYILGVDDPDSVAIAEAVDLQLDYIKQTHCNDFNYQAWTLKQTDKGEVREPLITFD